MPEPEKKPVIIMTAEQHHADAAECCNKATAEHASAAKSSAAGEIKKADQHAKNAKEYCMNALDHGRQAAAA